MSPARARSKSGRILPWLVVLSTPVAAVAQQIVHEVPRLETSRQRLVVRWRAPAPVHDKVLAFSAAIAELRGSDPRPLLVLRDEASADVALFKPDRRENETTLLLTQWFHCIKIGRHVLSAGHPWHALFAGRKPPLMLLVGDDGKLVTPITGVRERRDLHAAMVRVLKADYSKDPMAAVKLWLPVLDTFDEADRTESEYTDKYHLAREEGDKRREKRYGSKIKLARTKRDSAKKREARLFDLGLRRTPRVKVAADFDAEAAAEVRTGGHGLLDRVKKKEKEKGAGK